MINARALPKKRAKKGRKLQCCTPARRGTEQSIPGRAGAVRSCPRKMPVLAGSGVGAVPPSRWLGPAELAASGSCSSPRGSIEAVELMFTPHRLLTSLTSPTSAVIIRELEQMAAELAEKRKISSTAATCCEQVLPSQASQEDDSPRHQRESCRRRVLQRQRPPKTPSWGGQPRALRARGANHSVVGNKGPVARREPWGPFLGAPRGCVGSCRSLHLSIGSCLHPSSLSGNLHSNPALRQSSASTINVHTLLRAASPLGENKTGWCR